MWAQFARLRSGRLRSRRSRALLSFWLTALRLLHETRESEDGRTPVDHSTPTPETWTRTGISERAGEGSVRRADWLILP